MASQGLKLDEILAQLEATEQEKTAEEKLVEGLSDEATDTEESNNEEATEKEAEENVEENTEPEGETPTSETDDVEESTEKEAESAEDGVEGETTEDEALLKVAEDVEFQGQILARSFVNELQKIAKMEKVAVGDGPYTGNSADANKSVNQLPTGDVPEGGKVDVVIAKLKQLTGATEASQPSFEVGGDSQPAPRKDVDEARGTVAADAALAVQHAAALPVSAGGQEKTASDDIVNKIYEHFFTEEA